MLPIRRVVANYYDFADFTFLNAAWSAGWSTTDHKNEVKQKFVTHRSERKCNGP